MTPADVIASICASRGVAVDAVRGAGRTAWLVETRRQCITALELLGMGASDTARVMGRDPSTVLYHLGVDAGRRQRQRRGA
jgi:hypothetical protein